MFEIEYIDVEMNRRNYNYLSESYTIGLSVIRGQEASVEVKFDRMNECEDGLELGYGDKNDIVFLSYDKKDKSLVKQFKNMLAKGRSKVMAEIIKEINDDLEGWEMKTGKSFSDIEQLFMERDELAYLRMKQIFLQEKIHIALKNREMQ